MADSAGPDPRRIRTAEDLVRELDLLRRRAAVGARTARLSLQELSRRTRIPRSTVHAYISGVRLPPPDSLDSLVIALGADRPEQREWSEALYRVSASEPILSPVTAPPTAALRPRQLPAAPRTLVGRQTELAQLSELLAQSRSEARTPFVVGVSGTGGIGKTALTLRWAHDVADSFVDGQLWVDLRGYGPGTPLSPSDALEQLLRGVGVPTAELAPDVETRAALFRSAVAGQRLLIVLDNARESAQVLPLLPGSPGCATVVTSRTVLRSLVVHGVAETVSLNRLPVEIARGLIGTDRDPAQAELTERIARLCGGLPLALRIVRERLSRASAAELARFADELESDDRSRLAALEVADVSGEVSVREALRWSYEALAPDAAAMFRQLPLCWQSTFEVRTAAAVHGVPLRSARRLLDQLADASLLDSAGADRYRIHDLVLAFAAEIMRRDSDPAELDRARRRSLGYLLTITEAANASWDPYRPLRLARPAGVDCDAPADAEWTISHLDAFGLAIAEAIRLDLAPVAWSLGEGAARAIRPLADLGVLEPALRIAVASAMQADDGRAVAVLLRQLGINHGRRGELAEAEHAFDTAIEWAERHQLPGYAAMDRSNRAVVWVMRGDVAEGRRALADELDRLHRYGESPLANLLSLADLDLDLGDVAAAADWAAQSLTELVSMNAHTTGGLALEVRLAQARVELARQNHDAALAQLELADQIAETDGNFEYQAQTHRIRGMVQSDRGDLDRATASARRALDIATRVRDRRSEVSARQLLGEVAFQAGRLDEATELLAAARDRAESAGLRQDIAQVLLSLARVESANGAVGDARRSAARAAALAEQCGLASVLAQSEALLVELAA